VSVIQSTEHPALGWKNLEYKMSDEASSDTARLENAAAAAKVKLKNYRVVASLWSLATRSCGSLSQLAANTW